jgi:hypothetical protein
MKPVKRIKGTRDLPPTALLDPPKMKVEPELARLLINWALWRAGGQSIGRYYQYSALSVLRPGSPGSYQPPSMLDDHSAQVLAADASRVDRVVNAMAGDMRNALVVWWVQGGSVRQKARSSGAGRARCTRCSSRRTKTSAGISCSINRVLQRENRG